MRIISTVAICAALCGCASVTRGTTENITVVSSPDGATATVVDSENASSQTCVTPCAVQVKRNGNINVSVKKDGYQPDATQLKLESSANGALAVGGNVFAGGLIGLGVDAYNGAAYDHKPNPVIFTLDPLPTTPPPASKRRQPMKRGAPVS